MEDLNLYICDHVEQDCKVDCVHKIPHKRILDYYIEGKSCTYCNGEEGKCGFKKYEPMCKCVLFKE